MIHEEVIARARSCIGVSVYRKYATLEQAPVAFNCFRFIQWLWLPVTVPDHILVWEGAEEISLGAMKPLDLIFIARRGRTYDTDDFGHVGLLTDLSTVIHATRWEKGVVESSLSSFLSRDCLGIRRIKMPSL